VPGAVALEVVDVVDGDVSHVLRHDQANRALAQMLIELPFGDRALRFLACALPFAEADMAIPVVIEALGQPGLVLLPLREQGGDLCLPVALAVGAERAELPEHTELLMLVDAFLEVSILAPL